MSHAVGTIVDPIKDFEDRVTEKLRADIGALLPDEVVAAMVAKATTAAFFTRAKVRNPSYRPGYSFNDVKEYIDGPSWFEEEVARQVAPIIKATVAAALEEQRAIIAAAIEAETTSEKIRIAAAYQTGQAVGAGIEVATRTLIDAMRNGQLR